MDTYSNVTENEKGYYTYREIDDFHKELKFVNNKSLSAYQKNKAFYSGDSFYLICDEEFYNQTLKSNKAALEELSKNLNRLRGPHRMFKYLLRFAFLLVLLYIPFLLLQNFLIYSLPMTEQDSIIGTTNMLAYIFIFVNIIRILLVKQYKMRTYSGVFNSITNLDYCEAKEKYFQSKGAVNPIYNPFSLFIVKNIFRVTFYVFILFVATYSIFDLESVSSYSEELSSLQEITNDYLTPHKVTTTYQHSDTEELSNQLGRYEQFYRVDDYYVVQDIDSLKIYDLALNEVFNPGPFTNCEHYEFGDLEDGVLLFSCTNSTGLARYHYIFDIQMKKFLFKERIYYDYYNEYLDPELSGYFSIEEEYEYRALSVQDNKVYVVRTIYNDYSYSEDKVAFSMLQEITDDRFNVTSVPYNNEAYSYQNYPVILNLNLEPDVTDVLYKDGNYYFVTGEYCDSHPNSIVKVDKQGIETVSDQLGGPLHNLVLVENELFIRVENVINEDVVKINKDLTTEVIASGFDSSYYTIDTEDTIFMFGNQRSYFSFYTKDGEQLAEVLDQDSTYDQYYFYSDGDIVYGLKDSTLLTFTPSSERDTFYVELELVHEFYEETNITHADFTETSMSVLYFMVALPILGFGYAFMRKTRLRHRFDSSMY